MRTLLALVAGLGFAAPAAAQLHDVRVARDGDRAIVEFVTAPDAQASAAAAADGFVVSLPGVVLQPARWETTGGLLSALEIVNTPEGVLIAATTTADVLAARAAPSVSGVIVELALAPSADRSTAPDRTLAELDARLLGAPTPPAAPIIAPPTGSHSAEPVEPHVAGEVETAASTTRDRGPTVETGEPSGHADVETHAAEPKLDAHGAAEALAHAVAAETDESDAVMAAFNALSATPDAGGAAPARAASVETPAAPAALNADTAVVIDPKTTPTAIARYAPSLDEPACSAAEVVIRSDPWALDSLKLFGACLAARGEAEEARSVFDRLLSFDPADPEGHLGLGAVDEAAGDARSARRRYEQALKLSLSDAQAARARAFIAALDVD